MCNGRGMTQFISNRELLQRMIEAFSKGDLAKVQDYWAEDIIWHFPGT